MSKDFEELESEMLKDSDHYERELKAKQSRKLYVSNFLESREQAKISGVGGEMMAGDI